MHMLNRSQFSAFEQLFIYIMFNSIMCGGGGDISVMFYMIPKLEIFFTVKYLYIQVLNDGVSNSYFPSVIRCHDLERCRL